MYQGVDATNPGQPPVRDHDQWMGLYYVVGVCMGSLFVKNL